MERLKYKRVLLGITGGIAAYKACEIVRRLKEAGADVQVVMTQAACEFITPLTLQALSGNQVHTSLLDPEAEAGMGHIELARWADVLLIAPATADFMARLAHGHGDDLLATLCLATPAKIILAPAMNQQMWRDPATQDNLELLHKRDIQTLGPDSGEQACGDIGPGRMMQPEAIVMGIIDVFENNLLTGKHLVITAGPTREAIDPVRYISNHSSGKMGFALAEAATEAGALVTLIAGPVKLPTPSRVNRIDVTSAQDMLSAAQKACASADIFIASAAVADYRPKNISHQKIKKKDDDESIDMVIELTKNPDVLASIASAKSRPFCVGFAAETEHLVRHAREKLSRKNIDLIIANDVANPNIGFNSDQNQVTAISATSTRRFKMMPKRQLACELISLISEREKEVSS